MATSLPYVQTLVCKLKWLIISVFYFNCLMLFIYVLQVDQHKTNRGFGGAQIYLEAEEFKWFTRWLKIRQGMNPKSKRVIVTEGKGCAKNLVKYFQAAWAEMGLPGKPTFTGIRTTVSSNVSLIFTCFSQHSKLIIVLFRHINLSI